MEHLEHFQGDYGHYQLQMTADGSYSLFSENFQEATHAKEGAQAETDLYYIQGTQLLAKAQVHAKKGTTLSVLEVGFGTGLGYERTIHYLSTIPELHLSYVALEMDLAMVLKMKEWRGRFNQSEGPYPQIQDLVFDGKNLRAETKYGTLQIVMGDARQTLQSLSGPFEVIYQDAFSPLKNPHLWTHQWFADLKKRSHSSVRLSTFSGASRMRKSLLYAGWFVQEGATFGPKRTSTVAFLEGESSPSLLAKLERSAVPMLCDENLRAEKGGVTNE